MYLECMDDFQNIGVILQLVAMIILFLKIICTFDCTGISGKTQLLHALVFTTRFLDLPSEFRISFPSFIMKIIYLFIAYLTVLSIFVICKKTYERDHDAFRCDLIIGMCTVMSLLTTYKTWNIIPILWYFSVYLETFAIFPQIQFTARTKYVGSSLIFYVGMLACYRAFHIVHWAYLIIMTGHIDNYFVMASGTLQFIVYTGYFIWMIPIFKANYAHLKNTDSQPDIETIIKVQTNETNEKKNDLV